jgi:hypothetical protein
MIERAGRNYALHLATSMVILSCAKGTKSISKEPLILHAQKFVYSVILVFAACAKILRSTGCCILVRGRANTNLTSISKIEDQTHTKKVINKLFNYYYNTNNINNE